MVAGVLITAGHEDKENVLYIIELVLTIEQVDGCEVSWMMALVVAAAQLSDVVYCAVAKPEIMPTDVAKLMV